MAECGQRYFLFRVFFNETELVALKVVEFPCGKAKEKLDTGYPLSKEDIIYFENLLKDNVAFQI